MVNLNKISLITTLLIHILVVVIFKLLDNFSLIISIYTISLICGIILKFSNKNRLKKIGWGIFYGSLISLIIIGGFMLWLKLNYPK